MNLTSELRVHLTAARQSMATSFGDIITLIWMPVYSGITDTDELTRIASNTPFSGPGPSLLVTFYTFQEIAK